MTCGVIAAVPGLWGCDTGGGDEPADDVREPDAGDTTPDGRSEDAPGDADDAAAAIDDPTDAPNVPGPVCGNGVVEGGEQCDDANRWPGDDCEADCRLARTTGGTPACVPRCPDPSAGEGDGLAVASAPEIGDPHHG